MCVLWVRASSIEWPLDACSRRVCVSVAVGAVLNCHLVLMPVPDTCL